MGKPKPKNIKSIVIYKQQLFTLEEKVECRDVSWLISKIQTKSELQTEAKPRKLPVPEIVFLLQHHIQTSVFCTDTKEVSLETPKNVLDWNSSRKHMQKLMNPFLPINSH